MRSASYLPSSDGSPAPLRRRAGGVLLAIAIEALLLLALLNLAPDILGLPKPRIPASFTLLPEQGEAPAALHTSAKVHHSGGGASRQAPTPRTAPPATPPHPPVPPLQMMLMTKQDFAAADIAALPSHVAGATAGTSAGSSVGGETGKASGAGDGPGGERLYDVDWYRHPTHAELATYVPRSAPDEGWGEVACRTMADHHVEDCQQLGESPAGSGFGRAVREAAWQFLVQAPRVGSRQLVGTWVRIRITYSDHGDAIDSSR